MKTTHKILTVLLDEVNIFRAKVGLRPLYFLKEVRVLKLQKRSKYQLYEFPNYGDSNKIKVLKTPNTANELRLFLTGLLQGAKIGMGIASTHIEVKTQGGN